MIERLLVPLDGSAAAARTLIPATRLVRRLHVPLRVVSYVSELIEHEVRSAIAEQVAELDLGDQGVSVHVGAAPESVAAALVQECLVEPGTLTVMSTSGAGRTGSVLGSVADGFLARGCTPVLLIGPDCDLDRFVPGRPMVVPLDGSDTAESILPVAAYWATMFDAVPEVVSVLEVSTSQSVAGGDLPPETALVRAVAGRLAEQSGVAADYEVLHGDKVAQSIVDRASHRDAALIALSTHGRTGLARLVAGSVAMEVLHRAPCPVLVHRPPDLD
ncbi:MAG: universal stress protein [Acidimicrobiales bacterium]